MSSFYVTGVNWFPEKYVEVAGFEYVLKWSDGGERGLSRKEAARYFRMAREISGYTDVFSIERRWVSEVLPVCTWCGSRPQVLDWDIDGPYYSSSCDSDQCRGAYGV
ncbi:hypothetical protein Ssi03_13170 [Sphaerisporangium siamense]|uniref:Uncharacterized protein n=1 Tax=Sphaerisporangium siamense TaxID=795645 RepID=A0A7W7D9T5_9ACTN|nr:hypothetical protein [Sphaerisporangium siamense]MBB4702914.1 hypothetical protein [Sphaerisporangium siamense]GII83327.1 hypothetical protein Ssi03_13170 [Sphaerisporangium siamense]